MAARVCLVGVSGFGNIHYQDVLRGVESGRLEIAAAAVINQDEEAEKVEKLRSLGCRVYDRFDAMLEAHRGDAQFCMIPTGIPLHKPMTMAAVESGMHVLVEKPAAGVIQDVREMQAAAEKHECLVAVLYQHHYDPGMLKAKRLLIDGAIGKIQRLKSYACWPRGRDYYNRNAWAGTMKLGDTWVLDSPYNNALAHELALMFFWAGASERQTAFPTEVEGELYHGNDIESADTASLRFQTDCGPEVLFIASHAGAYQTEAFMHVRGDGGILDWTRKGWEMRDKDGKILEQWTTPKQPELRDGMIDAVMGAARGGDDFYCSLSLASAQTLAINAAHQACEPLAIGPEHLEEIDGRPVIRGVDRAMQAAYEQSRLFSEMGMAWASKPGHFRIPENYNHFPAE